MYWKKNVFIVFCLFSFSKTSHLSDNINFEIHDPGICQIMLITQTISCGSAISVMLGNEYKMDINSIIRTLNQNTCYSITLNQWSFQNRVCIIIAEHDFGFYTIFFQITKNSQWNPSIKYIIIINQMKKVTDIVTTLLKKNVYDFILTGGDSSRKENVYTYYPNENSTCSLQADTDNILRVGDCEDIQKVTKNLKQYRIREKNDILKGCIVTAAMIPDPPYTIHEKNKNFIVDGKNTWGLEQLVLKVAAEAEHFTVRFKYLEEYVGYGEALEDGSFTGLLGHLQKNEADIIGGGILLLKKRAEGFDYIYGHLFTEYKIFTSVRHENKWNLIYKEFDTYTWILIIICYCLYLILFYILYNNVPHLNYRYTLPLKLIGYFLINNTDRRWPKITRIRCTLACWIWFTFYVTNFYYTSFFSFLTSESFHKNQFRYEIESFKPCIADDVRNVFENYFNESLPKNLDIMEACHLKDNTFDLVASRDDLFTIDAFYEFAMREAEYIDEDGNKKIEPRDFNQSMAGALFVQRGSPLKDVVQKHLRALIESGILNQQLNLIYSRTQMALKSKKQKFKSLGMSRICVAFYVFVFGVTTALTAFFFEISICIPKGTRT